MSFFGYSEQGEFQLLKTKSEQPISSKVSVGSLVLDKDYSKYYTYFLERQAFLSPKGCLPNSPEIYTDFP